MSKLEAGARRASRGFSLVEVMVALTITAVGLLGLAKMESLAVSSTQVASARSLAAIQASSLAAAMHANPGYWASVVPTTPTTLSISGGVLTVVSDDPILAGAATAGACITPGATSCTPPAMAAYDLQQWAVALETLLPGSFSTITCSDVAPVTCTIEIQWTENAVAASAQQTQANLTGLQRPDYILYVQP
jgi:type IV pilus assembly protein PilV